MDEDSGSPQHLAAGSYIDLMLAAVTMQIFFIITAVWVGTSGSEFFNSNSEHIRYAMKIQLSLGWMMCIIAGIGFSILPLIYDVEKFDKSLMRTYVGMNVLGQLAIMLGVIIGVQDLFYTLSTIGITLLSSSLLILGPPALTIFKQKNLSESTKVGPFSYSIGLILPIIGLTTLVCWICRDNSTILEISESIIYGLTIPLAVIGSIISHFNRRLNWEIISPEHSGKIFGILVTLLLLAIISVPLSKNGDISTRVSAILALLPYLFIFVMLNPKKIIAKLLEKEPHSKMIVASVFWLPVIGIAAFLEQMGYVQTTDSMMSYYKWILIFGFSMQALWGFAIYLHEDHKKLSLHRRKTTWLIFLSLNVGSIITTYSMLRSWYLDETLPTYPRIGIAAYAISYLLILIHWIKDVFFSLDNWHKVPMFYDQYLMHPEEGAGYRLEN